MSDLISRQAVLTLFEERFLELQIAKRLPENKVQEYVQSGVNWCINTVRDIPSVENKGEWIPVTERLPETHQDVLLELRSGEMLTGFKAETEPYFYCHGVDGCYVEPQNVLAWIPIPEPYKAEKGGE